MSILTPQERESAGRCHHCEHHPPTQGHAPNCPHRITWRGSGTHTPLNWWETRDLPATPTTTTTTSRTDTAPADTSLTLDL